MQIIDSNGNVYGSGNLEINSADGKVKTSGGGGGGVTAVLATTPLSSSGGITPNISIALANATTSGYLSSTDWNTFNNKYDASNPAGYITSSALIPYLTSAAAALTYYPLTNPAGYTSNTGTVTAVTGTSPIASSGGTTPAISISQATTSTNGYLSSTDWNTFNGKQNALARYASATDGTPVSSTTTITLTSSQLIPANTFTVNNVIRVYVRFIKSTANANTSFYIYINTSASLTGATQLGILTTNNRTNGVKRDMYIKSATSTQVYPATLSTPTDDVVQSNAASSINIDWTTDKYIIFAIGHTGATDTGGLTSGYTIEKYA